MKKIFALSVLLLSLGFNAFAQGNQMPAGGLFFKNKAIPFSQIIELFPGDTMHLVLSTYDPNSTDSISISTDLATVLPTATYTLSNSKQPVLQIQWIPTNADVRLEPHMILVGIDDNASPIRGISSNHLRIRVNKPGSITLNNNPVNLNEEIQLQPGSPFNLSVSSLNPNLTDSIRITSNVASVLPGSTFITDNAKQQTAAIFWVPTASHVNAQPFTFTVSLQDSSVPGGKQYTYTFNVRVGNAGGVTGVRQEVTQTKPIQAYPNPFTSQLTFKVDQKSSGQLLIYNALGQEVDRILVSSGTSAEQDIRWEKAPQMPAGQYFGKLVSPAGEVQTIKFMKIQ
ncbi:T9SS type A sorting domain-containing protein [Adhaeribacter soli]|uniref:T9SS type A sorting domain-containing protein n=1 Tax=Adhaeribacter soli TaxID=2607655 RepID=A0A5N1J1V7_9BACT|nr:T9SS type A sorting domain-containing protein [Adhaeribacter soli]KAA9340569.1 T9SS type A sorting domain-containing protein [Adhaeribacter soli]